MRTRRPLARGTRDSSGIQSGVTWATNPSGVTMDYQGITTGTGLITAAELDYLTGSTGYTVGNPAAAKLCVSGISSYAGATVTLNTGLTAIESIITSVLYNGGAAAVTQAMTVLTSNLNNNPGCASACLQFSLGSLGATTPDITQGAGCSIAFIAFGT